MKDEKGCLPHAADDDAAGDENGDDISDDDDVFARLLLHTMSGQPRYAKIKMGKLRDTEALDGEEKHPVPVMALICGHGLPPSRPL